MVEFGNIINKEEEIAKKIEREGNSMQIMFQTQKVLVLLLYYLVPP